MDDPAGDPPLADRADAAGTEATEAFAILGNETRLSILVALWKSFEPFTDESAVPFSELYDRVDIDDSGQFNYHLDKLVDQFVERGDDGYRLTRAGEQIVQTVIAGAAIRETDREPVEIDEACPRCGAPVEVSYADERVHVACTTCPGWSRRMDGHLTSLTLPPAGLAGRSAAEIAHVSITYSMDRASSMMKGICPTCASPVEATLFACEDHDAGDGLCEVCNTNFLALAHWDCPTCKDACTVPSFGPVLAHPPVVSFLRDRGIDHDLSSWQGLLVQGEACREELVSTDPLRVRITVPAGADELSATIDDSLDVVSVG